MKHHVLLFTAVMLLVAGCTTTPLPAAVTLSTSVDQDAAWLDRLSWGASSASLAELRRMGRSLWLNAQLAPRVELPAELRDQINAFSVSQRDLPALVRSLEVQRKDLETAKDDAAKAAAQQAYQQALTQLAREAANRSLLLAIYSPNQVQEQLTWFWFNHFSIHQYKHNLRAMVGDYEQGLRERSIGRFRDLLGYTAHHPAMLRYLDNDQNAAGRINENYARELLELHTLGVNAGYSQRDIEELARVLTGLGVNLSGKKPRLTAVQQAQYVQRGLMEFNPARHDFGDKQLLGFSIKGRGLSEMDQVLDILARHPATARFVSRKLAQFFVSDTPPRVLIERMAQRWQQTDGDIADVMRTLIQSPEFEASLGQKYKDPQHYVVSAVRLTYDTHLGFNTGPMLGWLYRLGQAPYNRQSPDGYPLDESAWASPGQLSTRFEIALAISRSTAGLIRIEGQKVDRPAFPHLVNQIIYEGMAPRISLATRQTLSHASSPQEWYTYLLTSPEFMHR